jgi:hypothetical protein
MRRILVALVMVLLASSGLAHDSWISSGNYKNAAGEWCCGDGDCFVIPESEVRGTAQGYLLYGTEVVPYSEAQPSPDGEFWRCRRPDGSRRCFFAPKPNS